jgi:S1-C subfamily serine protease
VAQRSRDLFPAQVICAAAMVLFQISVLCSESSPTLDNINSRHEKIYQRIAPAIVAIQAQGEKSHYGSGVIISPHGLILASTTALPKGTEKVSVYFADGRVIPAKILQTHAATESCVLQAELNSRTTLPYLPLANSALSRVGELAYSAGNPSRSITNDGQVAFSIGTITGIYNTSSADELSAYSGLVFETDAAVNPGAAGGALVDSDGRLLGLLSMCYCQTRRMGTAIPIHLIQRGLAAQLRDIALNPKPLEAPPSPTVRTPRGTRRGQHRWRQ